MREGGNPVKRKTSRNAGNKANGHH